MHQSEVLATPLPHVAAIRMQSKRSFPRHTHSQYGIGVITAGGHRSWSGDGWVEAEAGDVICVNPEEVHDGAPVAGAVRRWTMLHLDAAWIRQQWKTDAGNTVLMLPPVRRDTQVAELVHTWQRSLLSPGAEPMEAERAMVLTMARLAEKPGDTGREDRYSPVVARARQCMLDAPAGRHSLAELAALCGVSRYQLLRAFRKETGMPPHAFLLQRRVERAREMLAMGLAPVEAALQAGFADQSHMTRAFVRQLGFGPGVYRRALRRRSDA